MQPERPRGSALKGDQRDWLSSDASRSDWLTVLQTAPRLGGAVLVILYVAGFLVINSHLSSLGITDFRIANPQYISAGALYLAFIGLFGLMPGLALMNGPRDTEALINLFREVGANPAWNFFAAAYVFFEVFFKLCLASAFFSSLAFGHVPVLLFYQVLILAFVVLYPLDVLNFDLKRPRAFILLKLVFFATAVITFFKFCVDARVGTVIATFFGYAFYMNFAMDHVDRFRKSNSSILYVAGFSFLFILASAVSFGKFTYGDVRRGLGGGYSNLATVQFKSSEGLRLPGADSVLSTVDTRVIYADSDYFYLEVEDGVAMISESNISAIYTRPEVEETEVQMLRRVFGFTTTLDETPGLDQSETSTATH